MYCTPGVLVLACRLLCSMIALLCACSFGSAPPIALVLACILLRSRIARVCLLITLYGQITLALACALVHLECHYVGLRIRVIHAGCYGVCMCNNAYTPAALV